MSVTYDERNRIFRLDTAHTTYSMALTSEGYLGHLYYGKRLRHLSTTQALRLEEAPSPSVLEREKLAFLSVFPFEYPTGGVGDYRESCLNVISADGQPGCELFYKSHRIGHGKPALEGLPASFPAEEDVTTLFIDLTDPVLQLTVTLLYSVFEAEDVITRSVLIRNDSSRTVKLDRVLSASIDMDNRDFRLLGLSGAWARERHKELIPLHHGQQILSSERGESSPQANPFLALVTPGTSEDQGEVYAMNFVYSGNFLAAADLSMYNSVRLCMGIHPQGFRWNLRPGAVFTAPEVVLTYSGEGLARMTSNLHHFYLEHLIRSPWKYKARPVLINNWEGTLFDFDNEKLLQIARVAADCGIELFVMDDGWFGARNSDDAGLGDWQVNEKKLAGGLPKLAEDIRALGMKFGIWIEPEMINMDSDLYRSHPDWAIQLNGRKPSFGRHQLVLDITRKEVRDTIMDQIIRVLKEASVDYVKWDMNRYLSDLGSAVLDKDSQGELLHRYVLGLYDMQERLVQAFPDLLFENCSAGGARFDPGMLYYSPQIWTSDDTDAIERLRIQDGTAMVYPASCMGAHVSAVPNMQVGRSAPLETRANVAMAGTFGYELDLTKAAEAEKEQIRRQIRNYHDWHWLCDKGEYYRLVSWTDQQPFDAWMFAARDHSAALLTYVQVLGRPNMGGHVLLLKGLDPDAAYQLRVLSGKAITAQGTLRYGDELMNAGLLLPPLGDYESLLIVLVRMPEGIAPEL